MMIEDLVEVERVCNKLDIEIDEIIKDMYETLCQDQKFSALTEIKVYIDLSSYYKYYNLYNNNTYNNNYNIDMDNNYYFYINILDHTTFLPIYRINIKTNDDIADETYTISVYQTSIVGNRNLIQNSFADKNNLKEIIQCYFKSLTQIE